MYHYKTNSEGKAYGEEPHHDFSDAPDSLRALAMAFRKTEPIRHFPRKFTGASPIVRSGISR